MGFFSDRQSLWQADPNGLTVPSQPTQQMGRGGQIMSYAPPSSVAQPSPTVATQPTMSAPAVATSGAVNDAGMAGASQPSGSLEQAIAAYQQSTPYSPQAYEGLFNHLKQMGFQVERPTRAGGTAMSDDKIVGPDGKMYDITVGVDGPNPTWAAPQHIPGEYWFNGQRVQRPEELGPGGGGWDPNATGRLSSFGAPGLAAPWTEEFQYPTGTDDPGFQWAMEQGQQGLERSAAAKGTLLTGGLLKDLAKYTTGAALQGYGDTWNRAKNVYDTNRGTFWGNQDNAYNRLAGMANTGANAAGQYATGMANMNIGGANTAASNTAANAANWQNTFGNLADLGTDYFRRRQAANKAKQIPGATPPYSPIENPEGIPVP